MKTVVKVASTLFLVSIAIIYNVAKDTEAKMTICAKYKNGDESCETVPFVIGK